MGYDVTAGKHRSAPIKPQFPKCFLSSAASHVTGGDGWIHEETSDELLCQGRSAEPYIVSSPVWANRTDSTRNKDSGGGDIWLVRDRHQRHFSPNTGGHTQAPVGPKALLFHILYEQQPWKPLKLPTDDTWGQLGSLPFAAELKVTLIIINPISMILLPNLTKLFPGKLIRFD